MKFRVHGRPEQHTVSKKMEKGKDLVNRDLFPGEHRKCAYCVVIAAHWPIILISKDQPISTPAV